MSRQEYVDFLLRKFSSLDESIARIGQRYEECKKNSEETRLVDKQEVETIKKWMINQEWRDGILRTAVEKMNAYVGGMGGKLEQQINEQKSINDAFRSDLETFRKGFAESYLSSLEKIDDNVFEKLRSLERAMADLKKGPVGISHLDKAQAQDQEAQDVEDVLKKLTEWIPKLDGELRGELDKLAEGQNEALSNVYSNMEQIRTALVNDQIHQEKFNKDVITDMNNLASLLKGLLQKQGHNSCSDCSEIPRLQECLMNQVLMNSELTRGIASLQEELAAQRNENETLRIKQELFNKSISLQVKALRDEMKDAQNFAMDTAGELSALGCETQQIIEQQDFDREQLANDRVEQQETNNALAAEIEMVRMNCLHFERNEKNDGQNEVDEMAKGQEKGAGDVEIQTKTTELHESLPPVVPDPSSDLFVLSSSRPPSAQKMTKTEVLNSEEPSDETIQKALEPLRQDINTHSKQIQDMTQEIETMRQKQNRKFKGIGQLNAKILNLIQNSTLEESILEKSDDVVVVD
ncbi:hypothetical protein B9Z55_006929 [Caenorhabditis nigoni]|uniref:Uncharacterized protein n=1 Tax=Caenorhabditis nigoni TaxID=1611254 RepID=A0A2G5V7F6_9PELO|nr:hypothetical protein B9Z55_006929 [Caenorhabditis nigoni]